MNTKRLILYHFESCPFCAKVRNFISANHLTIEMRDTRLNPEYRDELIKLGGKSQVPCLSIDGKALYESSDIITFLKAQQNG